MPKRAPDVVKAKYVERTIEVRIRFWTDAIADGEGKVRQRHCWSAGTVTMPKQSAHGIDGVGSFPFNSLLDVPAVIEKVLIAHGVKVHPSKRMQRYLTDSGAE